MSADSARELAEALGARRTSWNPEELAEIVADLLPVVDAIAAERAAEELRAAAEELYQGWVIGPKAADGLRARADALTKES